MFAFFAPKPYNEGHLPEVDGHQIYYAEYGNKKGEPVVIIHGGPGYFSRPSKAKYFSRKKYRIIMFDQRGCGKSIYKDLLKNNTIGHTLQDIDRLLSHLKIKQKPILQGTSFGSTLALLYAQQNPKKVKALMLSAVFLARQKDTQYALHETKYFYPEFYQEVVENTKNIKQLQNMINSKDEDLQKKAIKYYFGYEFLLGSKSPAFCNLDLSFLNGTRIAINYLANGFYIKENQILDNMDSIKNIPTLIVHNRLDLVCPIIGAYELSKTLNNAKYVVVPDIGHGSKLMSKTLIKEVKGFL